MSRKKDEFINTMNVGKMDTWNTGQSLKNPSSGWELGSAFASQQNLDPRNQRAVNPATFASDPRVPAAINVIDPNVALALQGIPAFNPADMGQMYAYQMGMMAMQAQQQAQLLNPQLLIPQAMPPAMHSTPQRSGHTKANLTYGEYKKLQQMQKDPNYRPEEGWNAEPQHQGDPRLLLQQSSVDSINSGNSANNQLAQENWEPESEDWDRQQNRGGYVEDNSRRNSNSKQRHRDDSWQDGPLSPNHNRSLSRSPNRSSSPKKPYNLNREPHESKNTGSSYDQDSYSRPRDRHKGNYEARGNEQCRGNYSRGRGDYVNYNNNYSNGRNFKYNGGNHKYEEDYAEHKRDRRPESPPYKRHNSYGARRSHNDHEVYENNRRSRHDEFSPDRRHSNPDRYSSKYDKYEKYDRRDERRRNYSKGPRSPREPPRSPSLHNNGDEEHRRKSESLNRSSSTHEKEMGCEENGNGFGRDSRNGRYGKRREGSVTSRKSNESSGSYKRHNPPSISSSRNSLENGTREWNSRHSERNGRSSRNGRPESPRPKSPVDPPRCSREQSYSVSPIPAGILPSDPTEPNGTNSRPKSPSPLTTNWNFEKNRGRPKSPEYSRTYNNSESRSPSPSANRKNSRYENSSPMRSERTDKSDRNNSQRRGRSRSPINNRRRLRSRSVSPVRTLGPRSPPESLKISAQNKERDSEYYKKHSKSQDNLNAVPGKRKSRFDIPDTMYPRKLTNETTVVNENWEQEVPKQVKNNSNDWHDEATAEDLAIERETAKVNFEIVKSKEDWDDENFHGTVPHKVDKKEIVEEKKFTVETFKTIPGSESWDDEDFQGVSLEPVQPVFHFKPITIKKDVWQIPKPPLNKSIRPPEPIEDPDSTQTIFKLDMSVPPPELPEEDTSEPLPPGVEFEEEYQPIVPSTSKVDLDEPLPPGVEEQETVQLTPMKKHKGVSVRVKRKFTDSPAEIMLNKILDNLDDIKNKSESKSVSSEAEATSVPENVYSNKRDDLESPDSPDLDAVTSTQNQITENLKVQKMLETIEREHLYPMKHRPVEESESPASPDIKEQVVGAKPSQGDPRETALDLAVTSSTIGENRSGAFVKNVEADVETPNQNDEGSDLPPPPPSFTVSKVVIDLDSDP